MVVLKSFNYSASDDAEILILGTMPGDESLRRQQYYGHPRNLFWKIMGHMFNFDNSATSYDSKLDILKQNKFALWDVLSECKRKGSLDSNIETASTEPNNFPMFLRVHSNIHSIFFNGKKAEELFRRLVIKKCLLNDFSLNFHSMP